MDKQIRTATAVVDIDEVHLLEHPETGEPVITQNLLDGKDEEGEPLAEDPWFSVATLKGTVEVAQDPLSLTKINIDQSNMPIGISTEPGDFNVNFLMPELKLENLKHWLANNSDDETYTKLKLGKKEGYGYKFNATLINHVLAVKAKTGQWFIFPNIQGSVTMQRSDSTWVLGYNGMVLAAANEANQDVYILGEDVENPVTPTM